jgi:aspartate-semialdehyde dehydrogenase
MLDHSNDKNSMSGCNVAVVGATGNVGREVIKILHERQFPFGALTALASARSVGTEISYGDDDVLKVYDLSTFNFSGIDIVLSSPGAKVSSEFVPRATEAGAVVIDNTSCYRMDPDVPLIVPEVNSSSISQYVKKGIIANPNCSTIQMVTALKPLHDAFGIRRVVVSTYQSTSGAGKGAMDELFNQTKGIYVNQSAHENREHFPKQIAFNVIPHIDAFMDDGMTKEEWKMVAETKKILDPKIRVHANCARVPTFVGHAEYINIETVTEISDSEARKILKMAPGISVVDHRTEEGYVTPAEIAGEDSVYISRIRSDYTIDNGLSFWCVADNLRKGAALNAVQIAEVLCHDFLS